MKGSVRKRGNSWSYTVDIGRDPVTGKRKQKTKGGFGSPKEAQKALNEVIYEVNKGIYIEPQKITFRDFAKEWFETHKRKLRDTTSANYETQLNKWIIPLLGNYKLQEIKPVHGQQFANQLLNDLKETSATKVLTITKIIFNHAVILELINKNPFQNISINKKKEKDVTTWTFEQLNHFLDVVKADNDFYHGVFAFAAFTGTRKGEVLGLSRFNCDLESRIITINQSVAETKEKGVYIDRVKTPSSNRKIAIDDFVVSILKEQIAKNNKMKLKQGKMYQDNGLIFCHKDGKIIRPTNLNKKFREYIKLADVPYIRFHDMRHTHATLLLELSTNPKIVSERLGHASVKITLDTYSHPSVEMQTSVAESFSESVRKTAKK